MKNLYFIILVFLCYNLSSQTNLKIEFHGELINNGDTVEYTGVNNASSVIDIEGVKVINSGTLDYQNLGCKKEEVDLVSGSEVAICWGSHCSPPWVNVSPYSVALNSGDEYLGFHGDFRNNGFVGISYVNIFFYDKDNTTDEVYFTVKFDISTSVNEISKNKYIFYPNPTSKYLFVILNEQISSYKIFDIFGNLVAVKNNYNKTNESIDVSSLKTGQYIIQIITSKNNYLYRKFTKI